MRGIKMELWDVLDENRNKTGRLVERELVFFISAGRIPSERGVGNQCGS
jgi:hypothetical protein